MSRSPRSMRKRVKSFSWSCSSRSTWEQRPTAMVFVTHSIEEAVLGHRVIVLKGRPIQGSP